MDNYVAKLAAMSPTQRNAVKKELQRHFIDAEKADPKEARAAMESEKIRKEREEQTKKWRLTELEIKSRVRTIRTRLEELGEMIMGVHFDIAAPDMPHSLDCREEMETSELAEHLNPFITGHYERVY